MNTVAVHPGLISVNDSVVLCGKSGDLIAKATEKGRVDINVGYLKLEAESGKLYYEYGNDSKKIEKIIS